MQTLTIARAPTASIAAAATLAAVWIIVATAHPSRLGVAAASTLAVGVVAAHVDLRTRRLPDRLVLMAAAPSVLAAVVGGAVVPATLGAVLLAGPLVAIHVISPSAMGFGDVKFALALGTAIGLFGPTWSLVALFIASGSSVLVGVIRRAPSVPFGPGLVAGAVVAVVTSAAFPASLSGGRLPWR